MADKSCPEKPEQKELEEHKNKRVLVLLITALGVTMIFGGFLYLLFGGLPFGFVVPYVNLGSMALCVLRMKNGF